MKDCGRPRRVPAVFLRPRPGLSRKKRAVRCANGPESAACLLACFPFETLRVSKHTACRFVEKNTVFPPGPGRAARCRRLAFCFSKGKLFSGLLHKFYKQVHWISKSKLYMPRVLLGAGLPRVPTLPMVKARWESNGGFGGRGTPPAQARGSPSPKRAANSVDRPWQGVGDMTPVDSG